jgi:benzodiazapine receptor
VTRQHQILGFIAWQVVSFIAAAIGASASVHASIFYGQLILPDWAPPASVFGPVWTILYALMGTAAWMMWRTGDLRATGIALALFVVQLVANALWSCLFFGFHRGGAAFADVVLLWWLIIATLILFWRRRPLAGALLIPYLLWVSFACTLNYSVWRLNPRLLG